MALLSPEEFFVQALPLYATRQNVAIDDEKNSASAWRWLSFRNGIGYGPPICGRLPGAGLISDKAVQVT
jgi:hypothetical protein